MRYSTASAAAFHAKLMTPAPVEGVSVDETAILDYAEAGLAPSDHYPVTAQVTF